MTVSAPGVPFPGPGEKDLSFRLRSGERPGLRVPFSSGWSVLGHSGAKTPVHRVPPLSPDGWDSGTRNDTRSRVPDCRRHALPDPKILESPFTSTPRVKGKKRRHTVRGLGQTDVRPQKQEEECEGQSEAVPGRGLQSVVVSRHVSARPELEET